MTKQEWLEIKQGLDEDLNKQILQVTALYTEGKLPRPLFQGLMATIGYAALAAGVCLTGMRPEAEQERPFKDVVEDFLLMNRRIFK